MILKDVASIAKQHLVDLYAADQVRDVRLESWLYDDHLMVWSLTVGFSLSNGVRHDRTRTVVRISEANKAVLSVGEPQP
jgi:hypothetical protein